MSDLDVPTHTSTTEWQSFENRMRHRRVLRCRLRALIAIEAGQLDAARAALDEARRLEPVASETASVERWLNMAAAAAPPRGTRPPALIDSIRSRRTAVMIAASLLIAIAALVWLAPTRPRPVGSAPSDVVSIEAVQVVAETVREDSLVVAPSVEPRAEALRPVGTMSEPIPSSSSTKPNAPLVQASKPESRFPAPEPGVPSPDRAISRTVEPSISRYPEPSIARNGEAAIGSSPELPVAGAPDLPSAPGAELPTARVSESPSPRGAESSAPVPAVDTRTTSTTPRDEPREAAGVPNRDAARVRSVLARYEAAYSALDPVAAQSVWPGVDGRALARAFGGLESQHVSLGRCDVVVQGSSARADCAGTATWTPKVGGGPRTEARRWTFELATAGADWRILQVQAR